MSNYKIFTDSNGDLPLNIIKENDITIVPLSFNVNGVNHVAVPENPTMTTKEFYTAMRQGADTTTSQINSQDFIKYAKPVLDAGEDIIYLGFSSGLSGSVNAARIAAEELADEYPDRKVIVLDTLCASLGQGLLVYLCIDEKKKGRSIDEVAAFAEANKLKVAHEVTVDDLNHLFKGGRLSKTSAVIGSVLGVKPLLHVDNEGKLKAVGKVRGRKASFESIIKKIEERGVNNKEQTVFISHGDCLEEAEALAKDIKSRCGVKDVILNFICPSIGSHSGPGAIAVFFMASERKE